MNVIKCSAQSLKLAIGTAALAAMMTFAIADDAVTPAPENLKGSIQPAEVQQEQETVQAAEEVIQGPRIIFEEKSHVFGVIHNDQEVSHIFKFKNIGNSKLVIENVKTGCGCTSTVLGEKEIAPGGDGQIEVKFNSRGKNGHQRQTVQVKTNDPVSPNTPLTIQMEIKRDFTLKPQSIYMGNLSAGETKEMSLTITAATDEIKPVKIESSSPNLTYELSEPKKNNANETEWTLKAKLLAKESSQNVQRETLTVHTNSTALAKIDIPVQARVVGDITISPTLLNFGTLKPGQVQTRDARLVSRSEAKLEIERIETNGLPVEVTVSDEMEGKIKKLEAVITAPDSPNQLRGNIDIYVVGQKEPFKLFVMSQVRQEAASVKPAEEPATAVK